MKKIYGPFIKATSWALSGILAVIGMGSCNKTIFGSEDDENMQVMYGVPWASYAVKGTVVDKVTQKPVKGIEVKIVIPDSLNIPPDKGWRDTTDAKGEFKLSNTLDYSLPLIVTDIDGEANGSYKADTVKVDDKNPQLIGNNGGWFEG